MAATNANFLCPNCFQRKEALDGKCPACGYDPAADLEKYPIALRPGSILNGKYIIGRVLGQGGFGITYLAWDDTLKIKAAVKEFLPESMANRAPGALNVTVFSGSQGEQFRYGMDSFLEEARVLAKFIGHPNIVGVRSYFQENGTAYLVMEYVEGTSFKQYIADQGGRVSWEEALRVLRPVMEALSAVHKEGILHRDVTPDNIYLTKDGTVKLLDFGAARYNLGDKSHSLDVILKAGYAPKEQYTRKGRQGPYTDVYSVAASMYAAISGYLPPESLERLEEDDLVPISNRGIRIPDQLEDAVLKGLEVNPRDRFQSMEEFLAAIDGLGGRAAVSPAATAAAAAAGTTASVKAGAAAAVTGAGAAAAAEAGTVSTAAAAATATAERTAAEERTSVAPADEAAAETTVTAEKGEAPAAKWLKSHKKEAGIAAGCCAALLALVIGAGALKGTKPAEPSPAPSTASSEGNDPSGIRVGDGSVIGAGKREDQPAASSSAAASTAAPASSDAAEPADEPEQAGQDEADKKAQEEADKKAKEEAKKAQEEADKKAKEEADKKAQEEAAKKAQEEADKKAREEAAKKAQEEADKKAREEAEKAKEETYVTNRDITSSNGVAFTYTGEWKDGKPNGQGTGISKQYGYAGTYTGEWKSGDLEGYGVYSFQNGNRYEGNWGSGRMDGYGVYTWANGERYEGNYGGGRRNGEGTMYNADGSVKESGIWKNDKLVEAASTKVENQSYTMVTSEFSIKGTYTGEWKDGKPNGKGTMTMSVTDTRWTAGDTLSSSNWVNGLIEGYGEWRGAVGKYDGNFTKGLKSGYGRMELKDGTVYDGQWSKGGFIG